jgi:hypothetical protein
MLGIFGYYKYQKNQQLNWKDFQQKRAHKLAMKHLQSAEKLLKENKPSEFYTSIIQSIENYFSYKFKISKSELSKEKILQLLSQHNINDTLKNKYIELINTCEMAKYAPVSSQKPLNEIFNETKDLIIQIENQIKNT